MKANTVFSALMLMSSFFMTTHKATANQTITCNISAKAQAQSYKEAIGEAEYISENDDVWTPFYTETSVDAALSLDQMQAILASNENEEVVEIWNHDEVLDFFMGNITYVEYGQEYSLAYARLQEAMLKDFSQIYVYKVATEESAVFKIYLFGRRADGKLAGLTTTSIET